MDFKVRPNIAPFDLPQNPTGFKQEPGAGFRVRATSLGRHETTRLALRAFHRKEIRLWQLSTYKPRSSGEQLET